MVPIFSVKSRSILLLAIWIPIYRFYSSSFWGWAAESFGWVRNGKRPESQVGPRVVHLSSIWGFLKWGILKTMGFNTKMVWWLDDWGVPILGTSIWFKHCLPTLPWRQALCLRQYVVFFSGVKVHWRDEHLIISRNFCSQTCASPKQEYSTGCHIDILADSCYL